MATSSQNVVLVKYNSSGIALWAKTVTKETGGNSEFYSVAVDASGNVYATGYQYGTGSYPYGDGVSVAGTAPSSRNIVLVKYDFTGNALWAKSVSSGTNSSEFNSVSIDASGNIYAAGYQVGKGSYTYGCYGYEASVAGTFIDGENATLVKYVGE